LKTITVGGGKVP